MEKRKWITMLTERAQLYGEVLPGVPLIEISGKDRMLIENHRGVLSYSQSCITVGVKYGVCIVEGRQLQLAHIHKQQLLIKGQLCNVRLQSAECP